ncbi:hypothetical protein [Bradyrhizobium sp. SZCCHNS2002]|uniref:hypothetical protein n=1 Tax=Bradyrhizobium sp. SZCCHNS2002 TaxID=3057302 RepID=UPI002915CFAA|nr:hypothetical protein [Bradyrhizobium sp. SZCCHNS2002]
MSEAAHGYLQFAEPVKNPKDGYYYQSYRFVDFNGKVLSYGDQPLKSWLADSKAGLYSPAVDGFKLAGFVGSIGQALLGLTIRKPNVAARGAGSAIRQFNDGLAGSYGSWPGSDQPWVWREGNPGIEHLQGGTAGHIGDGNAIGDWWNNLEIAPQKRSSIAPWWKSQDPWAYIPLPKVPPQAPALPAPRVWNYESVRDSAAAAGVPSRNNVFEYGFPEPGVGQPRTDAAPRANRSSAQLAPAAGPTPAGGFAPSAGAASSGPNWPSPFQPSVIPAGAPFDLSFPARTHYHPPTSDSSAGGLPGLVASVNGGDPSDPTGFQPPAGGLLGMIQDYMRNNAGEGGSR